MDFKKLERTDVPATGAIGVSVVVCGATVRRELDVFYEVVNAYYGLPEDAPWEDADAAAAKATSVDAYREMRRDFVVNRVTNEALAALGIVPALTPDVRVTAYPDSDEDFAFDLAVVERPRLSLSCLDPVEIEVEDVEVTDELVDARIAELMESRAEYAPADPHPVVFGDCVSIDVATFCEGKPVPRLTGKKMVLEVADGSMPDAFVGQLMGMSVGQTKTFEYAVERPRALSDDDVDRYLATVTVLGQLRKDVPELTDAWVEANISKASSVAEFRAGVAQGLEAEAEHLNRDTRARLANIELEKRLQGAIPDAFYRASREGMRRALERELAEKGQTIDDYYEQERTNEEELSVQMLIKSGENLRQGFALEALFDGRGMQLSEKDLAYACEEAFGPGSYDPVLLERTGKRRVVESAAKRMVALAWLADTAVAKG
ncbi:trigger factor [Gordonibacter massiliensis (ex Traore et al. 2017)]|uniref:trigger factor n=1 Tax=Gordonibacter massiliensis (ex Traore et al. 2017) TaxID=1841863 RepID=UPI001C8BD921|nr:trigger factor [Gordonibacter massiliensis (ex Traore et al. 2017)]MBX9035419.1 hypothetical protein [Gordonibacter massiliensis (ex Traore et al. 2017)]